VYRAYVHEAESLLYQIRLVGLGPALAVLLSQTEHKSKRRIYWDISKWIFKEQRIKGKNVRSLMESIVYGDPRFLLKATHSVVNFLEELVRLSQEPAYQPHARSNQS
ncbi:MAG TPA: type III-B CRISPR module-associated protein Cmr5, partial [Candidatus Obscuribacterales bacterium]